MTGNRLQRNTVLGVSGVQGLSVNTKYFLIRCYGSTIDMGMNGNCGLKLPVSNAAEATPYPPNSI